MTGRLKDISRSYDGKLRVMFEVDSIDELTGLEEKELSIEVKNKARKRSLNANAYFHVLVGKIADKTQMSKPHAKNMLLGRYGQRWIENDSPLIISVISKCDMYEREDIHCIPVGYATLQGKEFTHWAVIRPSHDYNTAEMAALIDGTIQEAKDLGIETLPPAELERMMKAWRSQSYKTTSTVTYAGEMM